MRPGTTAMDTFWGTAAPVVPAAGLADGGTHHAGRRIDHLPADLYERRAPGESLAGCRRVDDPAGRGVAGALATGTSSDRVGRRRILLVLMSLAPFLMIAFVYGPEWLAVPLLLLMGFAVISPQPVIMALVQDQFPLNRALANGTYLAITFLLQAVGIWVVGALSDSLGLTAAFAISAVVALVGIPAILVGCRGGTAVGHQMPELAFSFTALPGEAEREAVLLVESLRSFGGKLAGSTVRVMVPAVR